MSKKFITTLSHKDMKAYLNNKEYHGQIVRINSDNGYTQTKNHGHLCAIVNNSAFNKDGNALLLEFK